MVSAQVHALTFYALIVLCSLMSRLTALLPRVELVKSPVQNLKSWYTRDANSSDYCDSESKEFWGDYM